MAARDEGDVAAASQRVEEENQCHKNGAAVERSSHEDPIHDGHGRCRMSAQMYGWSSLRTRSRYSRSRVEGQRPRIRYDNRAIQVVGDQEIRQL
jgi:hypothetical protein